MIDLNTPYIRELGLILFTIGLLALGNIFSRLYYNVGEQHEDFNFWRLLHGIVKAALIIAIVGCVTVVWLIYIDLGIIAEGLIDPKLICYATSIFYFIKLTNALIEILGVKEYLLKKASDR